MLVENQMVEVTWTNSNKEHYISKGYTYTKNGDKFYVKVEDLPSCSRKIVKVKCDYCGKKFDKEYANYTNEIKKIIKKCACFDCEGKKLSEVLSLKYKSKHQEFLDICKKYDYIPISTEYIDAKTPLKYLCKKHGLQNKTLEYIRKSGCEYCKRENAKLERKINGIKEFEEICIKKGYTSLATTDDFEDCYSYLPLICDKHGKQYTTLANIKHKGNGCHRCHMEKIGNSNRLDIQELIKSIEEKNNNILLNPEEYITCSTKNLKIKCGSCGSIFIVSKNNYDKNIDGKCPDCSEKSYGEYLIALCLDKYNISYSRQEHFNGDCRDINPLPFDFYLPKYNICIEFDGKQHFEPIFGMDAFLSTLLHDGMKNNYCKWNNIRLIRIPYWDRDNIEQILIKELNLTQHEKQTA